jgi:hypothetical protein
MTADQQHYQSKSEKPSDNEIHNLMLLVSTTLQLPNQLQLSFIKVNTRPEGDCKNPIKRAFSIAQT